MKIAINGTGVAGPTLAYWLARHGHKPVLFEQAAQLRTGGYITDFWGLGYDIAEKMGLIPRIRELGYQVTEVRFVNDAGRKNGGFGTDVFARMTNGRFTSVRRSDLAATLYGAVKNDVETVFSDSVAAITEHDGGAAVRFDSGREREFDLVIGADGLHSRVRELVFGPESDFEVFLGYKVAAFEVAGYPRRDELVYLSYSAPGRQVARFSMRDDKTLFLFVFRDEDGAAALPANDAERRNVLRQIFGNDGWECRQVLKAMEGVGEIYFDRVSQIRMRDWSKGRIALIGDAAACVSLLAGEGTGLAMAEAYVLAGELARANSNHVRAFGAYRDRLGNFVLRKQDSARKFASSFAPQTNWGIVLRNLATRLMAIPYFADKFIGTDLRDDIDLPDYAKSI